MPAPILLLHTTWMTNYRGLERNIGAGGFDYAQEHGFGHELFNFFPYRNRHYGYAPVRHGTINIGKLGAGHSDDSIGGILVIWTAPDPDNDGRRIVGWYKNATVYRHDQDGLDPRRVVERKRVRFNVSAASTDGALLPVRDRVFEVPHGGPGLPGQSPAFFVPSDSDLARQLWTYVRERRVPVQQRSRSNGTYIPDPEHNKTVEHAAVACALKYYGKYECFSRESDNIGWDLEAVLGAKKLCIEVKGNAGSEIAVQVTPNEYDAMCAVEAGSFVDGAYRLFIVNDALGRKPRGREFIYSVETERWISKATREILMVQPRTAARIKLKSD